MLKNSVLKKFLKSNQILGFVSVLVFCVTWLVSNVIVLFLTSGVLIDDCAGCIYSLVGS